MSVAAISHHTPASAAAALDYAEPAGLDALRSAKSNTPSPEDIKKAAAQFEAIIIRQLLAPSIEPIMSGGIGGSSSTASGGGIYGHMLTEVLADNLARGGGIGLGRMLEQQLAPASAIAAAPTSKSLPKPEISS